MHDLSVDMMSLPKIYSVFEYGVVVSNLQSIVSYGLVGLMPICRHVYGSIYCNMSMNNA